MATLIGDIELKVVLSDPGELYSALTSWSHYRPKEPAITGDCELVITDMVAKGRIVAACLVHARCEAFLMLLTADDAQAFRERLGELVYEANSAMLAETMTRPVKTRI